MGVKRRFQLLFVRNISKVGDTEKLPVSQISVVLVLTCRCIAAEQTPSSKRVVDEEHGQIMICKQKWAWWCPEGWSQSEISVRGGG